MKLCCGLFLLARVQWLHCTAECTAVVCLGIILMVTQQDIFAGIMENPKHVQLQLSHARGPAIPVGPLIMPPSGPGEWHVFNSSDDVPTTMCASCLSCGSFHGFTEACVLRYSEPSKTQWPVIAVIHILA